MIMAQASGRASSASFFLYLLGRGKLPDSPETAYAERHDETRGFSRRILRATTAAVPRPKEISPSFGANAASPPRPKRQPKAKPGAARWKS